jgi:hypothetical protein
MPVVPAAEPPRKQLNKTSHPTRNPRAVRRTLPPTILSANPKTV